MGTGVMCITGTCAASDCCDANPTYDNIDGGSGADFSSCQGYAELKSDLTGTCATDTCAASDCCDANPTCAGFGKCEDGTHHLKDSPGDSTCSTGTCQTSECCDANPTCNNVDGSGADFTSCVTGTNHLKDVLTGTCATDTCVVSDCCQVEPSSSSPGNSDDVTGSTIDDTGGGGGGSDDDQQQTTSTGDASQDSNMTGLIVGVVVGVFAVAVLAVIVVVVVRRNKRQRTAAATRLSKVGINLQMNPMEKKQVPEDSPIPCAVPGWEMHMDKTSGQAYYHNPMSGETSWEKPLVEGSDDWVTATMTQLSEVGSNLQMNPLEKKQVPEDSPISCDVPGWEMHMDKTSGQAYYHNSVSGETSWEKPLVEGSP